MLVTDLINSLSSLTNQAKIDDFHIFINISAGIYSSVLRTVINRSIFGCKKEIKVSKIESSKDKLNREGSG